MKIWDNEFFLERADLQREKRREDNGILTFDCFNAKCKGEKVKCSKGHFLASAKSGTMTLTSILQGRTSGYCRKCSDFDSE